MSGQSIVKAIVLAIAEKPYVNASKTHTKQEFDGPKKAYRSIQLGGPCLLTPRNNNYSIRTPGSFGS